MAGARHFRELICWQLSYKLKLGIYEFAEQPCVKSDVRFYEQIRDAAASAPRNIAEGFARRSHVDFARFLDIARASLAESQNHLQDAVDRHYLDQEEFKRLNSLSERASAAVARLQRYLRGPQR
jgi:four helix bundle protein